MSDNVFLLKIFEWIDKQTILEILNNSLLRKYSQNEIVVRQWDFSNNEWYIIKTWEVEVFINDKLVASLKDWDIFWEIALLNEDQRTATIKAKTDLEVIVITQDSIIEMINNWNESINRDIMDRIEQNLRES